MEAVNLPSGPPLNFEQVDASFFSPSPTSFAGAVLRNSLPKLREKIYISTRLPYCVSSFPSWPSLPPRFALLSSRRRDSAFPRPDPMTVLCRASPRRPTLGTVLPSPGAETATCSLSAFEIFPKYVVLYLYSADGFPATFSTLKRPLSAPSKLSYPRARMSRPLVSVKESLHKETFPSQLVLSVNSFPPGAVPFFGTLRAPFQTPEFQVGFFLFPFHEGDTFPPRACTPRLFFGSITPLCRLSHVL